MKINRKLILVTLFILLTLNIAAKAEEKSANVNLNIITPSAEQNQIAPYRDFYVLGNIEGTVPESAKMQIELYEKAYDVPVQTVYADHKFRPENINYNYQFLNYYGENRADLSKSMMPDLLYDPSNPATFNEAWRKCTFSNQTFTAVFCGGTYDRDLSLTDRNGRPLSKLQEGDYIIKVKLFNNDKLLAESSKSLKIAYYSDKILSRFSPAQHFTKIKEFAAKRDFQVFLDLFPGYWSSNNTLPELANLHLFAEILPRWRLADALEYDQGRTHMVLYNISPKSATYSVEIGRLTYKQIINNSNMVKAYYYNIGEPELFSGNKRGEIVELANNDALQFTRADLNLQKATDNVLDIADLQSMQMDLNVYDGVTVHKGHKFALNGIIRPIKNNANEVKYNSDETYTIGRTITRVKYTLEIANQRYEWNKSVGLTRKNKNRSDLSVVEFRHIFELQPDIRTGSALLTVQAYDSYDQLVDGSHETINLKIA